MILFLTFLIWVLNYSLVALSLSVIYAVYTAGFKNIELSPITPIFCFCAWCMGLFGMLATSDFHSRDMNYRLRLVEDNTIAPKPGQSYGFLSKPTLKRSFLKEYADGTKIYFIGADAPRVR